MRATLMFVHAHPDDESSKGAATMARHVAEGHRVVVVTLTDGSRGEVLNPAMDRPEVHQRLPELRRTELDRALAELGVTRGVWFGYRDSGFVDGFTPGRDDHLLADDAFWHVPLDGPAERLAAEVRAERPQVVVTYPEDGGYPHPDHIRTHEVTMRALQLAEHPGDGGGGWRVPKVYACTVASHAQAVALAEVLRERGEPLPWLVRRFLERLGPDDDTALTAQVEVADHLHARERALKAHATQVDPDGPWFEVPTELLREVWPYEHFALLRSDVPVDPPEPSLLAGLAPDGGREG